MQHDAFEVRQRTRATILRVMRTRQKYNKTPVFFTDLVDISRAQAYGYAPDFSTRDIMRQRSEVLAALRCLVAEGEVTETTNARGWTYYALPTPA